MSVVAILPSIYPLWTDRCRASMGTTLHKQTFVVDNTVENRGVAASWNLGIDRMYGQDAEWLVIISAAMRFGYPGGDDFLDELDSHDDALAIEAGHGIGWHLIAFPRSTIDRVGRFDEVFHPAYCEDLDYGKRIALAFDREPPYWTKVSVDVAIAGFAHGIDLGHVQVSGARSQAIYETKWGGASGGREQYSHPYDDPTLALTYTGTHPKLVEAGLA